tara:strand:- start:1968 stop:2333 length:366 start_codon:yes stop_codon:yes gene_type:complete
MNNKQNLITDGQWSSILKAVLATPHKEDELYINHQIKDNMINHFIYDNYDRIMYAPGLNYVKIEGMTEGKLYVYNDSEMECAPCSFDQALFMAKNYFKYEAYDMGENIVCNYTGPRVNIWS